MESIILSITMTTKFVTDRNGEDTYTRIKVVYNLYKNLKLFLYHFVRIIRK